jgi:uncharacterized protein with HEPN domain
MTQHDPMVRVCHMRDHADEAMRLLANVSLKELSGNRVLQLALVQLIEIVGAAAARIPDDFRVAHPEVPWRLAADMRNKLIHGYDTIEYAIVFDTVNDDLPLLVSQLNAIINTTAS